MEDRRVGFVHTGSALHGDAMSCNAWRHAKHREAPPAAGPPVAWG